MTYPCAQPPDLGDFEELADEALQVIPAEWRRHLEGVAIRIEEFADEETLGDLGIESPFDLLGLYSGISMAEKSIASTPQDIDRIFLYRRPILDYWCETGEALDHVVRHVLIHEIGHHFGLSDDDMEHIEAEAEKEAQARAKTSG